MSRNDTGWTIGGAVDPCAHDVVHVVAARADASTDDDERKPLWRRTLSIAFTVAVLAFTVYLWPAMLGGSTRLIVVSGHSMEPTYALRDIVVMRDTPDTEVGDIVVFEVPEGRAEGMLVVHRVLDVDDEGFFVTQGDNRTTPDQWQLTEDDIVGKPLLHIPQGGKALGFIQNIWVIALLVGMVVLFLLWPDADDDVDEHEDVEEFRLPVVAPAAHRYPDRDAVRDAVRRRPGASSVVGDLLDRAPLDERSSNVTSLDETDALDRDLLMVSTGFATDDERAQRWLEGALGADVDAQVDEIDPIVGGVEDAIDEDAMADALAWLDEQLAGFEQPVAH